MEVVIPSKSLDFDFSSTRSSPYVSAPTPKPFGDYYCSAPTSPSHLSQFYRAFDAFFEEETESGGGGGTASGVPFEWEEKPGTPKSPARKSGDDFEFDVFSEDWETASVAADELFDGGVIKPLKPPPRLQQPIIRGRVSSPRKLKPTAVSPSPISQTKKIIHGAFSPRHKYKREIEGDAFSITAENATRSATAEHQRGRERSVNMPKSSSRRAARSVSPLRDARSYPWEEEKQPLQDTKNSSDSSATPTSAKGGHKKWKLMDFFLFRSASEGRAADKDPLKKYTEAIRHSSFRVTDSSRTGPGSTRKGRLSAHELHYTANRAVSSDLKKKTFLPYKQGILGRLAFNPAVHALANGFGFSHK